MLPPAARLSVQGFVGKVPAASLIFTWKLPAVAGAGSVMEIAPPDVSTKRQTSDDSSTYGDALTGVVVNGAPGDETKSGMDHLKPTLTLAHATGNATTAELELAAQAMPVEKNFPPGGV